MSWNPDIDEARRIRQKIYWYCERNGVFDTDIRMQTVNVDLGWEQLSAMVDDLYDALDIPNLKTKVAKNVEADRRKSR